MLVVTTIVLTYFFDSAISPFAMFRTLGASVLVAVGLLAVSAAFFRDPPFAGLVAAILVVAVGTTSPMTVVVVAALILVVLARYLERRRQSPLPWQRIAQGASAFVLILLAVSASTWGLSGGVGRLAADLRQGAPVIPDPPGGSRPACCPNIYVALLDGYPRWDTVSREFGRDDSEFLDGLGQIGFHVSPSSRSNYPMTSLTLSSMFGMTLLDDDPRLRAQLETGILGHAFHDSINDSAAQRVLHQHGYAFVTYSPGWEQVAMRRSDVFLEDGGLNEFEMRMLDRTAFGWVVEALAPDVLGDEARARADSAFRTLATIGGAPGGPRFVFVHVPLPHPPILFDGQGEPVRMTLDDWIDTAGYLSSGRDHVRATFEGQIRYVAARTLRALQTLVEADPEAVVVVMSDHGARLDLTGSGTADDLERISNFFAARTPGKPSLFGDAPTPVNVLPLIFNAYLGEDLPLQPDTSFKWRGDPGDPVPLDVP